MSKESNPYLQLLSQLDITQAFKTKGRLRRWSAKRTVGGAVVLEALYQVHEYGITWPAITLTAIGVLPLCLSFFEHIEK